MAKLTTQVTINAPKERVWEVMADLESIYKWNPGVSLSYSTSEQPQGEGATRHCDLNGGGYLNERAFDWREGEGYSIDIYESNAPLERSVVRFSLHSEGDATRVMVSPDYQLKFGPVGALLDWLIVRRQFRKAMEELLAGLKYHVETGEVVGDAVPKRVPAAA